jgi:hypothetical protein
MSIPAEDASLAEVAAALAAPGKGLLASDESVGTIGKRLERAGLSNDEVSSCGMVWTSMRRYGLCVGSVTAAAAAPAAGPAVSALP